MSWLTIVIFTHSRIGADWFYGPTVNSVGSKLLPAELALAFFSYKTAEFSKHIQICTGCRHIHKSIVNKICLLVITHNNIFIPFRHQNFIALFTTGYKKCRLRKKTLSGPSRRSLKLWSQFCLNLLRNMATITSKNCSSVTRMIWDMLLCQKWFWLWIFCECFVAAVSFHMCIVWLSGMPIEFISPWVLQNFKIQLKKNVCR